jgi:protein TonB
MVSVDDNKQDIVIAWTLAILVHVLFFTLSGKMFIKTPQFAIAPSREIDISLIDEPKEVVKVQEEAKPVVKKVEKIIPKIPKPIVKVIEKTKQLIRPKELIIPKQIMTSSAQVKVEVKPDYVQNPPPQYPELAKQMRQEGIVMLSVDVNKEGEPVNVEIIQSSGFRLLDQAALKAVRHWKFQPGIIANIPVESTVTVPINFRLEK